MTLFVVGNVTEDIVLGLPRLPSPGETLIAKSHISDIGGKGFNQALIAARCGMRVRLIVPIGRDAAGQRASMLAANESFVATLIEKEGPTDQSFIAVAKDGENHIISTAFAASALTAADVIGSAADASAGDTLLMQGNLSADTTLTLLEWARERGMGTTVNPSPIRWDYRRLWPLIDRLILNRPELVALSGLADLNDGIDMLRNLGVAEIIVTRGAEGAIRVADDGHYSVPSVPVPVVDTAGAGDTYCGMFVAATAGGLPPRAAMQLAARAAAITIGRNGTWSAFPSMAEMDGLFADTEHVT
jgi:ribokinase